MTTQPIDPSRNSGDASHIALDRLLRIDGRAAVVTGAGAGIGYGIARRLAEAGAHVLTTDVDPTLAEAAAVEIGKGPGRVVPAKLDVRDPGEMELVAAMCVAEFRRLDIWVNNAGIYPPLDPLNTTKAEFEQVLSVNLTGAYLGMEIAARYMIELGEGGVILNVVSTAGFRGIGAYGASKWALRGATAGMAGRLGRYGIRVLGVAPSVVDTPGHDHLKEISDRMRQVIDDVTKRIVLGREGRPDDVARVALFLVSDAASFMTGSTIPVDGGELVGE